jgi:hypothetical protein
VLVLRAGWIEKSQISSNGYCRVEIARYALGRVNDPHLIVCAARLRLLPRRASLNNEHDAVLMEFAKCSRWVKLLEQQIENSEHFTSLQL